MEFLDEEDLLFGVRRDHRGRSADVPSGADFGRQKEDRRIREVAGLLVGVPPPLRIDLGHEPYDAVDAGTVRDLFAAFAQNFEFAYVARIEDHDREIELAVIQRIDEIARMKEHVPVRVGHVAGEHHRGIHGPYGRNVGRRKRLVFLRGLGPVVFDRALLFRLPVDRERPALHFHDEVGLENRVYVALVPEVTRVSSADLIVEPSGVVETFDLGDELRDETAAHKVVGPALEGLAVPRLGRRAGLALFGRKKRFDLGQQLRAGTKLQFVFGHPHDRGDGPYVVRTEQGRIHDDVGRGFVLPDHVAKLRKTRGHVGPLRKAPENELDVGMFACVREDAAQTVVAQRMRNEEVGVPHLARGGGLFAKPFLFLRDLFERAVHLGDRPLFGVEPRPGGLFDEPHCLVPKGFVLFGEKFERGVDVRVFRNCLPLLADLRDRGKFVPRERRGRVRGTGTREHNEDVFEEGRVLRLERVGGRGAVAALSFDALFRSAQVVGVPEEFLHDEGIALHALESKGVVEVFRAEALFHAFERPFRNGLRSFGRLGRFGRLRRLNTDGRFGPAAPALQAPDELAVHDHAAALLRMNRGGLFGRGPRDREGLRHGLAFLCALRVDFGPAFRPDVALHAHGDVLAPRPALLLFPLDHLGKLFGELDPFVLQARHGRAV